MANNSASEFTPYFSIETGLVWSSLNKFELDSFNVESEDLPLKLAASYQFTPQWSAKVGTTQSIIESSGVELRIDENADLITTEALYETTLFSIEGGYTILFNESWQLDFDAGVIIGKEKNEISICPTANYSFRIGPSCNSSNATSTSSNKSTETSFIFGTSVMYNFSDNWGIKLGYNFSGYREGLTKREFLVQYRF
ncbi:hypothetical protein PTUN_b0744 [Pseudoalteromonas tunicata]|jgi:opacity protein-like surface antigen|uniref:Outer membrane protein beta-barrel domain-containing protein n=2 Tax=Pseudoalteromonas tunicata TaxID=314281 RepID=A4C4E9_9GAMM|nr:hypothetical protein PTUN_b0744 [Pseudoalteromonas tunicata]EAR30431.1 hypothetical protein PTD2_02641 [Pseudoalteromonas tunicata D2]